MLTSDYYFSSSMYFSSTFAFFSRWIRDEMFWSKSETFLKTIKFLSLSYGSSYAVAVDFDKWPSKVGRRGFFVEEFIVVRYFLIKGDLLSGEWRVDKMNGPVKLDLSFSLSPCLSAVKEGDWFILN